MVLLKSGGTNVIEDNTSSAPEGDKMGGAEAAGSSGSAENSDHLIDLDSNVIKKDSEKVVVLEGTST